jgi:hypothetical protein
MATTLVKQIMRREVPKVMKSKFATCLETILFADNMLKNYQNKLAESFFSDLL